MGSHFNRNTKRRNSPAWCKPGMFGGIAPTVDERPVLITAYVRWSGTSYGLSFNVIETVTARRDPPNKGWITETAASGPRIRLQVTDTTTMRLVDVTLHLYLDDVEYDYFTWHDVDVTHNEPWGTTQLIEQDPPERRLLEAQVLA